MLDAGGDSDMDGVVSRLAMPLLCIRRTKIERYRRCHPNGGAKQGSGTALHGVHTRQSRAAAAWLRRTVMEGFATGSQRRVLYDVNLRERVIREGLCMRYSKMLCVQRAWLLS
jgi:hypothetical protein